MPRAKAPTPPTTPGKTDAPVKQVPTTGPVKVKHKVSGKTFIVSKQYFEKHSDRLEVIGE